MVRKAGSHFKKYQIASCRQTCLHVARTSTGSTSVGYRDHMLSMQRWDPNNASRCVPSPHPGGVWLVMVPNQTNSQSTPEWIPGHILALTCDSPLPPGWGFFLGAHHKVRAAASNMYAYWPWKTARRTLEDAKKGRHDQVGLVVRRQRLPPK